MTVNSCYNDIEKNFTNQQKFPVTIGGGYGGAKRNCNFKSAYMRHLSGNPGTGPARLAVGVAESGQMRKNSGVVKAEGGSKINTKFFLGSNEKSVSSVAGAKCENSCSGFVRKSTDDLKKLKKDLLAEGNSENNYFFLKEGYYNGLFKSNYKCIKNSLHKEVSPNLSLLRKESQRYSSRVGDNDSEILGPKFSNSCSHWNKPPTGGKVNSSKKEVFNSSAKVDDLNRSRGGEGSKSISILSIGEPKAGRKASKNLKAETGNPTLTITKPKGSFENSVDVSPEDSKMLKRHKSRDDVAGVRYCISPVKKELKYSYSTIKRNSLSCEKYQGPQTQ